VGGCLGSPRPPEAPHPRPRQALKSPGIVLLPSGRPGSVSGDSFRTCCRDRNYAAMAQIATAGGILRFALRKKPLFEIKRKGSDTRPVVSAYLWPFPHSRTCPGSLWCHPRSPWGPENPRLRRPATSCTEEGQVLSRCSPSPAEIKVTPNQ
jgi:hypothetical protein